MTRDQVKVQFRANAADHIDQRGAVILNFDIVHVLTIGLCQISRQDRKLIFRVKAEIEADDDRLNVVIEQNRDQGVFKTRHENGLVGETVLVPADFRRIVPLLALLCLGDIVDDQHLEIEPAPVTIFFDAQILPCVRRRKPTIQSKIDVFATVDPTHEPGDAT